MDAIPPTLAAFARRHLARGEADPGFAFRPTRSHALIPFLVALHDALPPEGLAVVADLVWQTAPTPELARAFAPAAGKEKTRPIEGWEMQAEHAGFEVVERLEVPRAEWEESLTQPQRDALRADVRGAARLAAWALRRAP